MVVFERYLEKQCPCCGASRKNDKVFMCGSPIGISSPSLDIRSGLCKSLSSWINRITGGGGRCK